MAPYLILSSSLYQKGTITYIGRLNCMYYVPQCHLIMLLLFLIISDCLWLSLYPYKHSLLMTDTVLKHHCGAKAFINATMSTTEL